MKALLTGSRVYGAPREDSDLDMVVLADTQDELILLGGNDTAGSANGTALLVGSYRFGSLNLILCTTEWQFGIWARGTAQLLAEKAATGPVTRERAVEVFTSLQQEGKR